MFEEKKFLTKDYTTSKTVKSGSEIKSLQPVKLFQSLNQNKQNETHIIYHM